MSGTVSSSIDFDKRGKESGYLQAGDLVGLIHDFKSADNKVIEVRARRSGIVALVRGYSPVTTGDVVCMIGELFPSIEAFEKSLEEKSAR
jgi:hypothetical protein